MKNFRFSWFIGGSIVVLVLAGLFFDVWRSYAVKTSLESEVRRITMDCAKFLPFRLREAVDYGLAALEAQGIKPDPGSVTVSADGYTVNVSVVSDVVAYFAWIVGNPRMKFQARAEAEVTLVGSGPVESVSTGEIALAIPHYDDFRLLTQVGISPSGDSGAPEYALKAWRVSGSGTVSVGDTVTLQPVADFAYLKEYSSPSPLTVVIFNGLQGNRAQVFGFAALSFEGVTEDGQVTGRFVRAQAQGAPQVFLPKENDFGYVRGGTPRVTLK